MEYSQALAEIDRRLLFGVKPGLERIRALMHLLGDPQETLRFVHVAGTNGKGTACTLISSTLRAGGYTTGLYTSPYVLDFRERFQINGEMIPPEELIREVETVSAAAAQLEARGETVTEFEFITALAFHWFAARHCDIVVLEVGLGGLMDATNVIPTPEVAVIMSISYDHTAVLGDTLTQIATEKAGIIKPGGRVVVYPEQDEETWVVLRHTCQEKDAELYIPYMKKVQTLEASIDGTELAVDELRLHTPFLGEHQVKNAATALLALRVLRERGFSLPDATLQAGFEQAFIPARMEIVSTNPLCLLDGGHNPGCAAALREALLAYVPGDRVALMGIMADKDSREYLRIVGPLFSKIVTLRPENPRAMDAQALRDVAREFCPDVQAAGSPQEALERLAEAGSADSAFVVCGSFYLAAEMRPLLQKKWGDFSRP